MTGTACGRAAFRFTNLASGDYKLYIRAVSKEEPYLYFEERSIDISIARPVWFSFWAIACYVLLTVLMSVVGFDVMALRKQKKISDEKTRFFVNTAHDIRTPLTLIKAPLEEMLENKTLNEAETNNMHTETVYLRVRQRSAPRRACTC